VAGPETLRQLASFSERQISQRTGVHRNTIRLIRHGKGVKRSTYERIINFLRDTERPAEQA
jgi:transcriptional regulator with XRE-family HTH domain